MEIWDRDGLTDKGRAEFRSAIRKERNEQWDSRLKVIALVSSSLIGILGAVIGLVSMLKK
jgi:hypothetical protein